MFKPINIFYDLDGTLIDSSAGIKKAFDLAAFETYGTSLDFNPAYVGPTIDKLHDLYIKEFKLEQKKKFISLFRKFYDDKYYECCTVYEDVHRTLEYLNNASEISQFLFTNKPEKPTTKILYDQKLTPYFDYISCPDGELKGTKEDRISKFVQKKSFTERPNCYYIGDTEEDKIAAESNDLIFIFASYGYGESLNSKYSLSSIKEIHFFLNL